MAAFAQGLATEDPDVAAIKAELSKAVTALGDASSRIGMNAMSDLNAAFACSVPYLKMWGIVAGGWQMARAAQIAAERIGHNDPEAEFYRAKLTTARFYADHVLSLYSSLHHQIVTGSASVMRLDDDGYELDRRTLAQR
jgi:hypothetical protein